MKLRIYNLIKDDNKDGAGRAFDIFISALIVINVALIIGDTFSGRTHIMVAVGRIVEIVSVIIFTIEYILRIWTANLKYQASSPMVARLKYVVSGMAIIDLLAILPFYVPFLIPIDLRVLRTIRLVRLVRIFKLGRYSSVMSSVGRVIKKTAPQLISSMGVVALLMVVSSILMYYVESPVQPQQFSNAFSALWWAVATLTTVGYGDIYPITVLGKIISAIIALLGIGIVAIPTGIISAGFLDEMKHDDKKKNTPTPD